jgi:PAS domain S-box-containing protein
MKTLNKYERLNEKYEAMKQEASHYKKLFLKSNAELSREITENVAAKLDLNNKNQLLENRLKELKCLNDISKLFENEHVKLDEFLKKVIEIIVHSFHQPEYASVEIKYKDQLFQSTNFEKTRVELKQELTYENETIGYLSICYKEGLAKSNEDPFMEEEKQLFAIIANNLGQIIHRSETDRRLNMFQSAIHQSPLMISFTNYKTKKIEYVNPNFLKKFGLKRGDVMKDDLYNTPAGELTVVEKKANANVSSHKSGSNSFYKLNNEDVPFWQKTSLYPFVENGSVTHILGIVEDISSEMRDAEALRIAKENYEHIAQNVPEAIFLGSKNGDQLYANKKASELTGYSNSEILDLKLIDLVHPDDFAIIKARLVARLKGEFLEQGYEARIITKKGETKVVLVSGAKSKWMGEVVDLVVISDITDKKRFEDLLKIQSKIDFLSSIPVGLEKSLGNIFDSLMEFNWIDGGGVYVMNNELKELHLVFHEGLSKRFIKRYQVLPQGSEQYSAMMSEKTSYYLSIVTFPESKILIEEGIMELLIVPLLHDDRIIGALNLATRDRIKLTESEKMIFESIGTRIAQMIALIMIQDKLTIRNEELQTTLRDKQEKQQLLIQKSKLESLGEMAAGVAHEINQPLGVILLSLENVLFKISAKKASRQYLDDKFTSIFNNIGKIKTIIDHIRTFSHDQKSIIIERINVNEVIRSACSLINEQYGYHNISLNFNLDEDIGYALGNNQKMEQVIFNLLSNSKFALEEKDATTMAVPFEKEISIRTYSDDKKIYIDVKDNGTGIDKDDLLNIFNPFFTTKPVGVGTGLGLSIVYGIITEMKGLITIESERNEFTLVHVELLRYTVKT